MKYILIKKYFFRLRVLYYEVEEDVRIVRENLVIYC